MSYLRSIAFACVLATSSSCVLGMAAAGGGVAVGAAVDGEPKTMAIAGGVGAALGAFAWLALCFEPGGVYSMGRDDESRPWYCAGI